MGSKTLSGVWFTCYANDHLPRHVHGRYAGVQVAIDLLPDGKIVQSARWNAVKPNAAKRGDVRRILAIAATHAGELNELWEKMHGAAS